MKARILSAKTAPQLEVLVDELAGGAITIRNVGYSIDPKGVHYALVLFTPGAGRRDEIGPAASKFIADALTPETPGSTKEV